MKAEVAPTTTATRSDPIPITACEPTNACYLLQWGHVRFLPIRLIGVSKWYLHNEPRRWCWPDSQGRPACLAITITVLWCQAALPVTVTVTMRRWELPNERLWMKTHATHPSTRTSKYITSTIMHFSSNICKSSLWPMHVSCLFITVVSHPKECSQPSLSPPSRMTSRLSLSQKRELRWVGNPIRRLPLSSFNVAVQS